MTFFQTWNLPGSSFFTYVCFDAPSRKAAMQIGDDWQQWKCEQEVSASQMANGNQGQLISATQNKKDKWNLDEDWGRERFFQYTQGNCSV